LWRFASGEALRTGEDIIDKRFCQGLYIEAKEQRSMRNNYVCYAAFFLLALFASCKFGDDLIITMDKKTFDSEYSQWQAQNIQDYQFAYRFLNDADSVGPVKITVRENKVASVENAEENNDLSIAKTIPEVYDFIQGTFDFIESVRNGSYDGPKIKILTLKIEYDDQYHYPQKVDFFEGYAPAMDGGGYYTLRISDFTPLK
jgi:hypothetical protein